MLAMTFLITAFVLVPMGGGLKKLMFSGNGLYHHTLCPVLSVLSYLLWEPHASIWLLPVAVTFLYGIIMLIMNVKEKFDGPYEACVDPDKLRQSADGRIQNDQRAVPDRLLRFLPVAGTSLVSEEGIGIAVRGCDLLFAAGDVSWHVSEQ